jgi:hypothetical protein
MYLVLVAALTPGIATTVNAQRGKRSLRFLKKPSQVVMPAEAFVFLGRNEETV